MSSKFLRGVEIIVWARFLSTYNNRKMKTYCINRTKYNSLLSTPILLRLFCAHAHHPRFTMPESLSSWSQWYLTCYQKKKWVEKIQQKDCHNCYRHWTPPFNFLRKYPWQRTAAWNFMGTLCLLTNTSVGRDTADHNSTTTVRTH